ncbi:MAG: hypothetical protein FD150_1936 [Rhodobacteraceae bacterium]|nr:MAG: hypothetical protein FD150_1936 [Paracoccaceae bacterium]
MPSLLILMPTGGQIETPTVHSLIGLTQALPRRSIPFALKTYEWSDLVISRNYLMSFFLAEKTFTHALLLDSDMSFHPQVFFDLLDFDADFTVAPYPQRQMRWSTFRALIEREAQKPEADRAPTDRLLAESYRYNVAERFDAGAPGRMRSGAISARSRGPGPVSCFCAARCPNAWWKQARRSRYRPSMARAIRVPISTISSAICAAVAAR